MPSVHVANAGAPLLLLQWGGMWIVLLPVIVIEAIVLALGARQRFSTSFKVAGAANLLSTLVGIPAAWALSCISSVFVEIAARPVGPTMHAITHPAWLHPYEEDLLWMIPLAVMVFLVPALLVSVAIEGYVAGRMLPDVARGRIWISIIRANVASYLLLFAVCVLTFHFSYP